MISHTALTALALTSLASSALVAPPHSVRLETRTKLTSRAANIHISFDSLPPGPIDVSYGSCLDRRRSDSHHTVVGRHIPVPTLSEQRLVWMIPDDAVSGGCLSAWAGDGTILVGRSEPQELADRRSRRDGVREIHKRSRTKKKRDRITMADAEADALGPWFDGVEALKKNNISAVDVAAAKSKKIGIVGAGMAGLMTFLALRQAGFENLELIEGGNRLGGRVHTVYLSGGPFDYSYQEMGPMRFPYQWSSSKGETFNITDHQLVFQLAAEMNEINNHAANWSVDFIPWIQRSQNGLYYYNGIRTESGLPPTRGQVADNASLSVQTSYADSTTALQAQVDAVDSSDELYASIATNMFEAHREFIDNGLELGLPGDQWSEFAYMVHNLEASLNDTDIVADGSGAVPFWDSFYEGLYFSAAEWMTIDGGLNRLPLAFHPLVDNSTTMNRKIERVEWDAKNDQVKLQWRNNYTETEFQTASYDYAVVAVPFSVVKNWRLPAEIDITMKNAITHLVYTSACKVSLEFAERFWEKYDNPIYGSCSTSTDIPGIGTICYPSYNINGTGPATMLGSYVSGGGWGERWASVSDEEHMQYVLQAMIEIHGEVARQQFTGKYDRLCWLLDPLESAAWAAPGLGQHELYLPEYFKTHQNMIFVGEHTSYTHAWIASALESGIRGSVQLMLELGLVEEAQATVEKWMARWIEI